MGGALGFLVGTAMNAVGGYAQEKHRQKQQRQQQHDNLLLSGYQQHPELADTPDAQGFLKKKYGGDVADMFLNIGKAAQQMQKEVAGAVGPSGASPTASGQGAPVAPATAPRAPGGPGLMMTPAPNATPASAPAPSGARAPAAPPDNFGIGHFDQEIQRLRGIQIKYAGQPAYAPYDAHIENAIKDLQHQRDQLTQQQFQATEHADNRAQHEQDFQATEADRAQTRQIQLQNHADSIAMQQQFHKFTEQMATATSAEGKQVHFANAQKNLASQTQNIAKMLTSVTPADPSTVKSLLTQRNAMARQLKQQAEKSGLDYDPEEFKPLTIEQVPGFLQRWTDGKFGGSSPAIVAAPEAAGNASSGMTATNAKGEKVQWDGKAWTPVK